MGLGWKYLYSLLVLFFVLEMLVYISVFGMGKLQVVACDVGQGDGILIQKGTVQMLIDGGRGNVVSSCLSRHMPFWDRKVEVVLLTHAQEDHYGGLVGVVREYGVGVFVGSGVGSDTEGYKALLSELDGRNIETIDVVMGDRIVAGDIYFDVLWPDRASVERGLIGDVGDFNDFSIVGVGRYGEFDALFTGDIGAGEISGLVEGGLGDVEYLKVPHHGSKNGLTEELLITTTPEVAVISAGVDNWYGHPHGEVLEMLSKYGVDVYRTDLDGDVVVESDGDGVWVVE